MEGYDIEILDLDDTPSRFKNMADCHPDWATKDSEVKKFVDDCNNDPAIHAPQGSEKWIARRAQRKLTLEEKIKFGEKDDYVICVGGSEIPTIAGLNKYETRETLKNKKIEVILTGKSSLKQADIDQQKEHYGPWGHMIEPMMRQYVETLLGTKFYEIDGTYPHPTIPYFKYSPDGIGTIRIKSRKPDYVAEDKDEDICETTLLELKAPFRRVVSGIFPRHYLPQPLSGTSTFDMVQSAVFAEGNWYAKSIRNLFKALYNSNIHGLCSVNGKKGIERFKDLKVLDCAVICLYSEIDYYNMDYGVFGEEDYEGCELGDLGFQTLQSARLHNTHKYKGKTYNLVDFGNVDFKVFYELMKCLRDGFVKIKYYDTYTTVIHRDEEYDPYMQVNSFDEWCKENGKFGYGFVPISLYNYAMYYLRPDKLYVNNYATVLKEFSNYVKQDLQN